MNIAVLPLDSIVFCENLQDDDYHCGLCGQGARPGFVLQGCHAKCGRFMVTVCQFCLMRAEGVIYVGSSMPPVNGLDGRSQNP